MVRADRTFNLRNWESNWRGEYFDLSSLSKKGEGQWGGGKKGRNRPVWVVTGKN